MTKGVLFVLSAPSGCGKGTLMKEILNDPKIYFSVSATTRKPREGEIDGVHYYFLSEEQFQSRIQKNELLEYASYCDHYYGTPREKIEAAREAGRDVFLEIEVQGAMQIRKTCPDAVLLFLAPPSVEELERRLNGRGTEDAETVASRLQKAKQELAQAHLYDYIIVNDVLEDALSEMKAVICAERLRASKQETAARIAAQLSQSDALKGE